MFLGVEQIELPVKLGLATFELFSAMFSKNLANSVPISIFLEVRLTWSMNRMVAQ